MNGKTTQIKILRAIREFYDMTNRLFQEFYWDFLISLNSWEFTEIETLSLRNMNTSSYLGKSTHKKKLQSPVNVCV